jgi:hypothetical protein
MEVKSSTIPRSVICAIAESVIKILNSKTTAHLDKAFPSSLKRVAQGILMYRATLCSGSYIDVDHFLSLTADH